ncbi:MAG: terminase family protein [Gemmatimonadota bacterium]
MSHGQGTERLARRKLDKARKLVVPTMPDPDVLPPDPLTFAKMCGFVPDAWQADVLTTDSDKTILCCSRQSGKSTVTALRAVREAVYVPNSLSLLLAPALRQSGELFRKCMQLYQSIDGPVPAIVHDSALRLELDNGSRIIALPGSESTTRGYSACTLVVIDEAARVPDDLIAAVRPSLATTDGRLIVLSTPWGRRGYFYKTWFHGEGWTRMMIKAEDCPRISSKFLEAERRELGEFNYSQEYECEFLDSETSVFSSALIERALSDTLKPFFPRKVA